MDIERKTALITGASRGIGKGIAIAMAKNGFDLMISHLNDYDNAEETALTIMRRYGGKCEVFNADLQEEGSPGRLVEKTTKALGHIDALVNNAGVTEFSQIRTMDIEKITS